jgi:hypothetical protein
VVPQCSDQVTEFPGIGDRRDAVFDAAADAPDREQAAGFHGSQRLAGHGQGEIKLSGEFGDALRLLPVQRSEEPEPRVVGNHAAGAPEGWPGGAAGSDSYHFHTLQSVEVNVQPETRLVEG